MEKEPYCLRHSLNPMFTFSHLVPKWDSLWAQPTWSTQTVNMGFKTVVLPSAGQPVLAFGPLCSTLKRNVRPLSSMPSTTLARAGGDKSNSRAFSIILQRRVTQGAATRATLAASRPSGVNLRRAAWHLSGLGDTWPHCTTLLYCLHVVLAYWVTCRYIMNMHGAWGRMRSDTLSVNKVLWDRMKKTMQMLSINISHA